MPGYESLISKLSRLCTGSHLNSKKRESNLLKERQRSIRFSNPLAHFTSHRSPFPHSEQGKKALLLNTKPETRLVSPDFPPQKRRNSHHIR